MSTKSLLETKLEEEIASALDALDSHDKNSDEYGALIDRVTKLYKLKSEESNAVLASTSAEHKMEMETKIKPPSLDTVLVVGANLLGILWLTRFERENVISSKALGFVMKPR